MLEIFSSFLGSVSEIINIYAIIVLLPFLFFLVIILGKLIYESSEIERLNYNLKTLSQFGESNEEEINDIDLIDFIITNEKECEDNCFIEIADNTGKVINYFYYPKDYNSSKEQLKLKSKQENIRTIYLEVNDNDIEVLNKEEPKYSFNLYNEYGEIKYTKNDIDLIISLVQQEKQNNKESQLAKL